MRSEKKFEQTFASDAEMQEAFHQEDEQELQEITTWRSEHFKDNLENRLELCKLWLEAKQQEGYDERALNHREQEFFHAAAAQGEYALAKWVIETSANTRARDGRAGSLMNNHGGNEYFETYEAIPDYLFANQEKE